MPSKQILVVGGAGEKHSHSMIERLRKKGAEPLLFDTLNFPEKVTFSLADGVPVYQGKRLEKIDGCYIRSVFYSLPPYDLEDKRDKNGNLDTQTWYVDYRAERERQALLGSALRALDFLDIPLVNPIRNFDLHYLKPLQVEMLRREGVPVPATLVTNNPAEVADFLKDQKRVIYKPVAGGAQCRELSPADMTPEKMARLKNAPVLFQQFIPGDNVRVYALKDRILAAVHIKSDEIDYRQHEKGFEILRLSPAVEAMCLKAMRVCGYYFTGMDLRRTPEGGYVVIECNPSAMFLGIEQATGIDIGGPLCDYLMSGKR